MVVSLNMCLPMNRRTLKNESVCPVNFSTGKSVAFLCCHTRGQVRLRGCLKGVSVTSCL